MCLSVRIEQIDTIIGIILLDSPRAFDFFDDSYNVRIERVELAMYFECVNATIHLVYSIVAHVHY